MDLISFRPFSWSSVSNIGSKGYSSPEKHVVALQIAYGETNNFLPWQWVQRSLDLRVYDTSHISRSRPRWSRSMQVCFLYLAPSLDLADSSVSVEYKKKKSRVWRMR
jgi:hypothetical protein